MHFDEYRRLAHRSKEGKMEVDRLYNLERALSVRISWALYRLFPNVKATHVTFISYLFCAAVLGVTAALYYAVFSPLEGALTGLALLYAVNIADKVDGEIARATNYCTQKGVYYDRTVHTLYPILFYLLIGTYFYTLTGNYVLFVLTIALAVITQQFLFFREARLLIGDQIKKGKMRLMDVPEKRPNKKPRLPLPLRVIDYFTFLIYDHTLFFYVAVILVSMVSLPLSVWLYTGHLSVSLLVNSYKVFYSYPTRRLFSAEEVQELTS